MLGGRTQLQLYAVVAGLCLVIYVVAWYTMSAAASPDVQAPSSDIARLQHEVHLLRQEFHKDFSALLKELHGLAGKAPGKQGNAAPKEEAGQVAKGADAADGSFVRQVQGLSSQRCLDRNPYYPDNMVKLYICHGGKWAALMP